MKLAELGVDIVHHGAINGVTGSCHQLFWQQHEHSLLVDCGLFQGAEASPGGANQNDLGIDFDLQSVRALIVTHCHIDHVGRIPYLLAAGYKGPIWCTQPTAKLLPLVIEDAVKIGFTRKESFIKAVLKDLRSRLVPVPYGKWEELGDAKICFRPAGHILGSAYVECRVPGKQGLASVLFSGDLGAPHAPLLPVPKAPYGTDALVIESTYGDREHEKRATRKHRFKAVLDRCLENRGTVLIPAFSIGRTQEILYELEEIIFHGGRKRVGNQLAWEDLDIIVDSPLASRFTQVYRDLKPHWDAEALTRVRSGRHPLSFDQLTTVGSHKEHLNTIRYLKKSGRPAVVIAASGMCSGGRIINYLKALISDARTDLVFVGYQARGTPGRAILTYGPDNGWVSLDGQRFTINAKVHRMGGYSAHADRSDLLRFVKRMRKKPRHIRIVHGDDEAKASLREGLHHIVPQADIVIPE